MVYKGSLENHLFHDATRQGSDVAVVKAPFVMYKGEAGYWYIIATRNDARLMVFIGYLA